MSPRACIPLKKGICNQEIFSTFTFWMATNVLSSARLQSRLLRTQKSELLWQTFPNKPLSILCAIASFRLSGIFLERMSFCWTKINDNVSLQRHTMRTVYIIKSNGVFLLIFMLYNEFETFPVTYFEHCFHIETGRNTIGKITTGNPGMCAHI